MRAPVFGLLLALALALAAPGVVAQSDPGARAQSLADIRAELEALRGEMDQLKRELVATGGAAGGLGAAGVLDRVQAMDEALRALTAQTEALDNRLSRIAADAGNRLADLEFRLIELEGGDPATAGQGGPLGGEAPALAPPPSPADGPSLAVGEQAAFDAAEADFAEGDWEAAVETLGAFAEAYPAGPLTGRALAMRAEALDNLDEPARAARAWLAAFEADPEGPAAPAALAGLGRTLAALGQLEEGCIMLEELEFRFPDSPEAADVADTRRTIGCP